MNKIVQLLLILLLGPNAFSQNLSLDIQQKGALFTEGQDTILFYQAADKDLNGRYARANYVHPLYSLDGEILTEDFPADHLHHRGVFWAWHQLYVGDKRIGNGWETKDLKWEVQKVKALPSKGKSKKIRAEVVWKSPLWTNAEGKQKALLAEMTTITVYPSKKKYRQIDFEISLLAIEPEMRIGGSEDAKGYGGFSPRIRLADNMVFTGPDGIVQPQNLPVEAEGWMDITGPIGKAGSTAGVTIFCQPENPGYPSPWILRAKGSMQNAVYPHPGAQAIELSNTKPTTLRYRLLVHNGLKASKIASLYRKY